MPELKEKLSKLILKRVSLTLFFCLITSLAFAADTTPPTGSIKINNGASSTNSINVTLNLSATDSGSGVAEMKFSNNNSTWSTPEAYATAKAWSLTSGSGTKTVYVKYKDNSGNWSSTYSDSIRLDTTLPTGSIKINNGAAKTNAITVTLNLSASDGSTGISQMQFSNDGITWSTPEAYSSSKGWGIPAGDGTKTVYAKFRDGAGNWSIVYSDSIILDTTAPVISGVTAISSSASGAKISWATDELSTSQVEYGLTAAYGYKTGINTTMVQSHSVSLSSLKGYTLYHYRVISKDSLGNQAVSGDFTFTTKDTTAPTGSIKINNGAASTNTINVTLNLSATDTGSGVAEMKFSNNNSTWTTPEAYSTIKSWVLSLGSGTKTVYVKFKDNSGNWSSTYSDSINLPNQAPQIDTVTPDSGSSSPGQAVNFTTTFSDANGWQNIQYVYFLINISTTNLSKCFYGYYNQNTNKLYLRNDANTGWLGGYAPGSSYIIENSYVKLDCSKTTVLGNNVNLTINWNLTFKSTFIGTKNMHLYVKDDSGAYQNWTNVGTWIIQDVDTVPPEITAVTPNDGSTFYENDKILISPTVNNDDLSPLEYQFSVDGVILQAWSGLSSYNWTVTSGTHTIKIEVRDEGGQDTATVEIFVFRRPIIAPP